MSGEVILESDSKNRRRGRPRSIVRDFADHMDRAVGLSGCQRTKVNQAYRIRVNQLVFNLKGDEQRDLLGATEAEVLSGKKFPPGWDTAAEEIGRFLVSIEADDDTAAEYLRVAVQARRDGIGWRGIRSHFRSLRLGERKGNAIALWIELSRVIDAYLSRFPATTNQMIVGAVESLLEVVSENTDPEDGSPSENELTVCD